MVRAVVIHTREDGDAFFETGSLDTQGRRSRRTEKSKSWLVTVSAVPPDPEEKEQNQMIKTMKQRMEKDEEEGFTLIELLVVVLILGILMAIAIPTFLSLTGSAKTNAAESDLTTASEDAATFFTQNGYYQGAGVSGSATTATGMYAVDSGINWTSTLSGLVAQQKEVYDSAPLVAAGGTSTLTTVTFATLGSDNNLYWIDDSSGTLTYAITKSTVTAPASGDFVSSWSLANSDGVKAT